MTAEDRGRLHRHCQNSNEDVLTDTGLGIDSGGSGTSISVREIGIRDPTEPVPKISTKYENLLLQTEVDGLYCSGNFSADDVQCIIGI